MTIDTYRSRVLFVLFAAAVLTAGLLALVEATPARAADRSFEPAPNSPISVGTTPTTVTNADFNGDGKADLAAQNSDSNNVSVLLSNGDGTFQTKQDFAVGASPSSVTSADFNADAKADLAVSNSSSNSVSVLIGNGDGTFQAKQDFPAGSSPSSVIGRDLNADGFADLAVANYVTSKVSILLGQDLNGDDKADGSFGAKQEFSIDLPCGGFCIPATANPNQVIAGHFNGDAAVDLATANMGSCSFFCTPGGVSVLLGTGGGSFQDAKLAQTGAAITSIAAYGSGSIAAAQYENDVVSLLRNNGDGTFSTGPGLPVGSEPSAVASADLNADGVSDLAVSNFASDNVSVLWGSGGGSFQPAEGFPAGDGPIFVIGADLDADSFTDLAVANQNSNNVSVLLNTGTVDTTAPTINNVSPADQSQNVSLGTNVEATFSEAMNASTLTTSTLTLTRQNSNTPVAATVSYSSTTNKATLNPSSNLASNATYTATIKGGSTGAKDSAGNALVQDYSWTFTTALPPDTTAPRVSTATPTGTGVARGTNATATFSERMDPTSVTTSTFKLFRCSSTTSTNCATQITNVTITKSTDRLKATLNPFGTSSTLLSGRTKYKVVVTTGAKDEAGNQLDQDASMVGNQQKVWYFTTGRS